MPSSESFLLSCQNMYMPNKKQVVPVNKLIYYQALQPSKLNIYNDITRKLRKQEHITTKCIATCTN